MTLTKKTVISVSLLMLTGLILMSALLFLYITFKFRETEIQNAKKDMVRILGVLEREIDAVDSYCKDYAFWDDTYYFMIRYDENYVSSNYNVPYLKTQRIHFICHVNLKGKIVYKAVYKPDSFEPADFNEITKDNSVLRDILSVKNLKEEKGLINSSLGYLMISSRPVSDSYMKAPANGKILMGRFLAREELARISSMLKVNMEILPLDAGGISSFGITDNGRKGSNNFSVKCGNDVIRIYSALNDLRGNPIAAALLNYQRDIKAIGVQTVKFTLLLVTALSLFLMGLVLFFLRRGVLQPVEGLTAEALEITRNRDFSRRLPESEVDEFLIMARSFNSILDMLVDANSNLEAKVIERTSALTTVNQELVLMRQIFEYSLEGIVITNSEAEILSVNPAFTSITGYTSEEVAGENPRMLKSDLHDNFYFENMWKSLKATGHWASEIWNRHKDGKAYPEWLSISAIRDLNGNTTHYVGIFHDISDIKRQEELIKYQAYHDALTGLPNRILLKSRIDKAIAHSTRNKNRFGVIFLDLDNFKVINDSLGHAIGDLLLKEAADRLRRIARNDDTVARLGGDEFIILVEDIADEKPSVILSRRIIQAFREPFCIKGNNLHVGASIGIAMYPEDGEESDSLIKNADAAMYRAKDEGRQTFALFKPSLNESVARKLKIENELRQAINDTNFEVYYQPKMDIKSGSIMGMEGLVRWKHAQGIISPAEFIPLAEEIGLISEIDRIVMHKAFREVSELINSGMVSMKLALNCSAKSLHYKGLPDIISSALSKYNFKPEWFELEITETSIMRDIEASRAILYMLLETGISITLDDFGTGYSSLSQLKNLPIHTLKIDASFIREIENNRNDAHITESIIAMSRRVGIEVVAEGVEKETQLEFLKNAGCDIAQGYLISRPIPMKDYKVFIGISN
ncbi:MAG TPA: EAL domain-containing protein [Spirochaetota bacterium]|nr:EAL domain-containing protein [Spirochaetota bacterium]